MAENGCSRLYAGLFLDLVCQLLHLADTLGNDYNEVLLARLLCFLYLGYNIAVKIERNLWYKYRGSADGDTRLKSYPAGSASHDLTDAAALV